MGDLSRLGLGNLLVVGRAGMDLYADPPDTRSEDAARFFACLGGSSGNIAAGLLRLGVRASIVTSVSDDAVGRFVRNQLERFGIGTEYLFTVGGEARTSLAVTETRIENTQTVIYRNDAADFQVTAADVATIDYSVFGGMIVTGTALAAEPSRSSTLDAIKRASDAGLPVILDIDYRRYSWSDGAEAASVYRKACMGCDVVVGNNEEFDVVAGDSGGLGLAASLAQSGKVAVYKMGEKGARTYWPEGSFQTGIFPVAAIKPMGAGDAFMAGFIAGLVHGRPMPEAVLQGSAAAAIVVSGIGCAPAMPTSSELDAFIAENQMTQPG